MPERPRPTMATRINKRSLRALVVLAPALGGCDPAALTENGVVAVIGELGLRDGSFSYPRAVATAGDGAFFVVDKSGRIQRFGPDGTFETSWAMPESSAGKPVGLSVHPDGRLFVADTHYHRVCVFSRDGALLDMFGREGTRDGEFLLPTDVAFDSAGNIYVAEYQGNDRITKWSADFEFVGILALEPIEGIRLSRPAGIAIDRDDTLWIADACNHRIVHLDLEGRTLNVFGGFGDQPGKLRYPYDIDLGPDGSLLVCEYEGNRLQWFTRDGVSVRTWGSPGRRPGELFAPWGAAYGPNGRVYVVDYLNHRVQIIQP